MNKNTKLYEDLGVKPDATPEEIKKAYRDKARKHHPDHGGNNEDFHKIQLAYTILSNAKSRRKYDETGNADDSPDTGLELAVTLVVQYFDEAFTKGNHNPIKFVRYKLAEDQSKFKDNRRSLAGQVKKIKDFLKSGRLKKKGKKYPDYIVFHLNRRRMDLIQQMALIGEKLKIAKLALEIASEYEYREKEQSWQSYLTEAMEDEGIRTWVIGKE